MRDLLNDKNCIYIYAEENMNISNYKLFCRVLQSDTPVMKTFRIKNWYCNDKWIIDNIEDELKKEIDLTSLTNITVLSRFIRMSYFDLFIRSNNHTELEAATFHRQLFGGVSSEVVSAVNLKKMRNI